MASGVRGQGPLRGRGGREVPPVGQGGAATPACGDGVGGASEVSATGSPGKVDIERELRQGRSVEVAPVGWSMYPTIVAGRDRVIVDPVDGHDLRRGDVVLFRRDTGGGTRPVGGTHPVPGDVLVLHRVCGGSAGSGYALVGDNQLDVERPVMPGQVCGRLRAVVRVEDGRTLSARSARMCLWGWLWVRLLPLRPCLFRLSKTLRRGPLRHRGNRAS
jgi:signal peptidase